MSKAAALVLLLRMLLFGLFFGVFLSLLDFVVRPEFEFLSRLFDPNRVWDFAENFRWIEVFAFFGAILGAIAAILMLIVIFVMKRISVGSSYRSEVVVVTVSVVITLIGGVLFMFIARDLLHFLLFVILIGVGFAINTKLALRSLNSQTR
jgi:hypothetical protein